MGDNDSDFWGEIKQIEKTLKKVALNLKIFTHNLEYIFLEHYFMEQAQVIIKYVLHFALATR